MKKKKPDIFLGITMGMLVLEALLCLVILIVQKTSPAKKTPVNPVSTQEQLSSGDKDTSPAKDTSDTGSATKDTEPAAPSDITAIDEENLKKELDDNLDPLASNWDVQIFDPVTGTRVTTSHHGNPALKFSPDTWMEANRMLPVFIMGAAYQQVADGKLTEDQISADVQAMIVDADYEAADRLTELMGGGNAAAGMTAVKSFAEANGMQISYNHLLTDTSGSQTNWYKASLGAQILDMICSGKLVSKEASEQMKEIICTPRKTEAFETGLQKAESYGFITDIEQGLCCCTMGIVNMPTRSFVVSIGCYDPKTVENVLARFQQLLAITEPYFAPQEQ